MRRAKKFSEGGRAKARMDRRMADIEKDYRIALAKGKPDKVARAKRDQRIADAKDDYAKRTGGDRTETKAAEKAAERNLSAARRSMDKRTLPVSLTSEGSKSLAVKVDMPKVKTPKVSVSKTEAPKKQSFGSAFAAARRAGKSTFTWNGKSYTTAMKGESRKTPIPASTATPKAATKDKPSYAANFGAPRAEVKSADKPKSVGRRMAERSAQRQQGQIDELINTFSAPFRSARARGAADDKARGYAKGGRVDGCAVRGKTRATRKK